MKNLLFFIAIFFIGGNAFALNEGTFQVIIKKQEEKINTRWSLSEHMLMKKKFALMDQWLAIHTSPNSPEFAIWGARNKVSESSSNSGNEYGALFYYNILGLEAKLEEVSPIIRNKNILLGLRIFGAADQGSHIKLLYGMEEMHDYKFSDKATSQVAGAATAIYLLPFLGVEGGYRKFMNGKYNVSNTAVDGQAIEYGAFLDAYFLRLYYKQQKKSLYYKDTSTLSKKTFKTNSMGVMFYF